MKVYLRWFARVSMDVRLHRITNSEGTRLPSRVFEVVPRTA